jgi:hypothetical protein
MIFSEKPASAVPDQALMGSAHDPQEFTLKQKAGAG